MQKYIVVFIIIICNCCNVNAQNFSISGIVLNENNIPLSGAHVHSSEKMSVTNEQGEFTLQALKNKKQQLNISYIGYRSVDTLLVLSEAKLFLKIKLQPSENHLDEIVLCAEHHSKIIEKPIVINPQELIENFTGSLAKSLEHLPGVSASEIGAGASKPMIRGFGFNRVVVAENDIKHESQQWGGEHGLEIDALTNEQVEIVKGAGAIAYGSDAMGGVIRIKNNTVPAQNGFSGESITFLKSVNNNITQAFLLKYKKNKFFYKIKGTIASFGDYKLPTDTITYLTVKMPVANGRLKNTAGKEQNVMGQIGYVSDYFQSVFTVNTNYLKSGFFPGAHGVPSIKRVEDDGNKRNIDFPFQEMNHIKLISNNKWHFNKTNLMLNVGYQYNHRKEFSQFHTHYSGQEKPLINPDLELDFKLNTLETKLETDTKWNESHLSVFGIQFQNQKNTIGGYNFLLPKYDKNNLGFFYNHVYHWSEHFNLQTGVRADFTSLNINPFYDNVLYDYLIKKGKSDAESQLYAERSKSYDANFKAFNYQVTLSYNPNEVWNHYLNVGSSFRIPTPIELAANGIHHGSFRHEQGDPTLDAEKGFGADFQSRFKKKIFDLTVSPFVYYYQNYLFLKPTGVFSPLPHGGQVYQYAQSKALMSGFEVSLNVRLGNKINYKCIGEYLYSQQITSQSSQNYPLPFSPPNNIFSELSYDFTPNNTIFLNLKNAFTQNRIAQNEKITKGYTILGGGIKSNFAIKKLKLEIVLQASNVFNVKYFNHTNFYRALEIPEMGRNIQLLIKIPFDTY